MKTQIISFALILVFLLGLFVATERSFSPNFEQCITSYQANNSSGVAEKSLPTFRVVFDSYVQCTGTFIDSNANAITAFATIIIAAFTCTLWIATSQQSHLTREVFIADKRAFVFAAGIQPVYELNAAGQYDWRIGPIWQNSGATPTKALTIYTDGLLTNLAIPA